MGRGASGPGRGLAGDGGGQTSGRLAGSRVAFRKVSCRALFVCVPQTARPAAPPPAANPPRRRSRRFMEDRTVGYDVVPRGTWQAAEKLPEGWASLQKSARLTLHTADAALVGITSAAVVLADAAALRVALRAPRPGEESIAMCVSTEKGKGGASGRCAVNLSRAVHRLGLDGAAVAGRYELSVKGEGPDGLLILSLSDPTPAELQKHAQTAALAAARHDGRAAAKT